MLSKTFFILLLCFLQHRVFCGYEVYGAYWSTNATDCNGQPDAVGIVAYSSVPNANCATALFNTECISKNIGEQYREICLNQNLGDSIDLRPPYAGEFNEIRSVIGLECSLSSLSSVLSWVKDSTCTTTTSGDSKIVNIHYNNNQIDFKLDCDSQFCNSCTFSTDVIYSFDMNFVCVKPQSLMYMVRKVNGFQSEKPSTVFSFHYNSENCQGEPDYITVDPVRQLQAYGVNETVIVERCVQNSRRVFVANYDPLVSTAIPFNFTSLFVEVRDAGYRLGCPTNTPTLLSYYTQPHSCFNNSIIINSNTSIGVFYGQQCNCSTQQCLNYKSASLISNGYACSSDSVNSTKLIFALWRHGQQVPFEVKPTPIATIPVGYSTAIKFSFFVGMFFISMLL